MAMTRMRRGCGLQQAGNSGTPPPETGLVAQIRAWQALTTRVKVAASQRLAQRACVVQAGIFPPFHPVVSW